jgi:hypothetical protein
MRQVVWGGQGTNAVLTDFVPFFFLCLSPSTCAFLSSFSPKFLCFPPACGDQSGSATGWRVTAGGVSPAVFLSFSSFPFPFFRQGRPAAAGSEFRGFMQRHRVADRDRRRATFSSARGGGCGRRRVRGSCSATGWRAASGGVPLSQPGRRARKRGGEAVGLVTAGRIPTSLSTSR